MRRCAFRSAPAMPDLPPPRLPRSEQGRLALDILASELDADSKTTTAAIEPTTVSVTLASPTPDDDDRASD